MDIKKLTTGQQKALHHSLENQKSMMTSSEKKALEDLRMLLSEEVDIILDGRMIVGNGKVIKCGNLVKIIDADTYGDDYRFGWIKLKETMKGEYFTCQYYSNKRIYIL